MTLIDIANDLAKFTQEITIVDRIDALTNGTYLELSNLGLTIINHEIGQLSIRDIYSDIRFIKSKHELLIEVIKSKPPINIFDLTAGLGRDSLIMANYGYKVTMVERNPILATILYYALKYKVIPNNNLTLIFADSLDFLNSNQQIKPDIIYLDPMFNAKNKSLAKKDMQLVQALVDKKEDNIYNIFTAAQTIAQKSIIVKRDIKQSVLFEIPKVSYNKSGKVVRYDVYLTT